MNKSQIVSGDIFNGGHRIIVAGINCRDNCSSVAIALSLAFDFEVTYLTRLAEASSVGSFVKLQLEHATTQEILGLVLRLDHRRPVQIDSLRAAARHMMRYLGARRDLVPHDVAMVAIGTGDAHIEGGFASLLRILHEEGYPGIVYEPLNPDLRLSENEFDQIGLKGSPLEVLPQWKNTASAWTHEDEVAVTGAREHHEIEHMPTGLRDSYLTGEDADSG